MSRQTAGTGLPKQTEVDTEAAPQSAANFEEQPAIHNRISRPGQTISSRETGVALQEIVNQMIDDQTMVQACQMCIEIANNQFHQPDPSLQSVDQPIKQHQHHQQENDNIINNNEMRKLSDTGNDENQNISRNNDSKIIKHPLQTDPKIQAESQSSFQELNLPTNSKSEYLLQNDNEDNQQASIQNNGLSEANLQPNAQQDDEFLDKKSFSNESEQIPLQNNDRHQNTANAANLSDQKPPSNIKSIDQHDQNNYEYQDSIDKENRVNISRHEISQISSPSISQFGETMNSQNLQGSSLQGKIMEIYDGEKQQSQSKTSRIPQGVSSNQDQHSQKDLDKMLMRQSSKKDVTIDAQRKGSPQKQMTQRRTSGSDINNISPRLARVQPRVPSALDTADTKSRSKIPSLQNTVSNSNQKHKRNDSKYDYTGSDVRSQDSSNHNFSMKHKSPKGKLRTQAPYPSSNNNKTLTKSTNQMERVVPHVNLKFQKTYKKNDTRVDVSKKQQIKHQFNPANQNKESETPTFTVEPAHSQSPLKSQKKPLRTFGKWNQQSPTAINQNKKSLNYLQKSVEIQPNSSYRSQMTIEKDIVRSGQSVTNSQVFDNDARTPIALQKGSFPLSSKINEHNRSQDREQTKRNDEKWKHSGTKHQKNQSILPNPSQVSIQVSQNSSNQRVVPRERKLSQSGQSMQNLRSIQATKSQKSTSQYSDKSKTQSRYTRPRVAVEKHEEESESSKRVTHVQKDLKTPTKQRELRSRERKQQQSGAMSPLLTRSLKNSEMPTQKRVTHAQNDFSDQNNASNQIFQRKQSHQVIGQLSLKEKRLQHQMLQQQEDMRHKNQEIKTREKKQWDKAAEKVAREMLDHVLSNIAETGPDGLDHEPEGAITATVIEAIQHVEDEQREYYIRHERAQWAQAIKMVQKKLIRSVTQRCVTEIIQESTDAIYKFEDDAISLADWVLRSLLQKEIRNEIFEAVKASAVRQQQSDFIDDDEFSIIQPQEAFASDRDCALEIPQERVYNPNQYSMNFFDSQTNSSKFEELADNTPSKQSQADRILYDQMMEEYSITRGRDGRHKQNEQDAIKAAQNDEYSQFLMTNGSILREDEQSFQKQNMNFQDSRLHQSNIMRESSRGLDKIRKSVIQQQSERYLMKKGRKTNSRGSLPNINSSSFQTSKIINNDSQRIFEESSHQIQIGTQGNKPRDDEGIIVVKKFGKPQNQPNSIRKIQNPNDSLRFIRNPSKYSSNQEGNQVVEQNGSRRAFQTPNMDFDVDGHKYNQANGDRSYQNTKMDSSNNMDNYLEELNATTSQVSGPYFGKSMILSAQKSPKGQVDIKSRTQKGAIVQNCQVMPVHGKTAFSKYQQSQSALGVRNERKKQNMEKQQKHSMGPFEEAQDSKQHAHSYIDHEIQRYSRNIDADEEGVRQEAQTSRLPGGVISPSYTQPQFTTQAFDERQVQTTNGQNEIENYQHYRENSKYYQQSLVKMPKSRVTTINVGERDSKMASHKKVKQATIAIHQLMKTDGEQIPSTVGASSHISSRSNQQQMYSDNHHNVPAVSSSLPKHAQMMNSGMSNYRQGVSQTIDTNQYQNYDGAYNANNNRKQKKMIVTNQNQKQSRVISDKHGQSLGSQVANFPGETSMKGPHLISQERLEDENRMHNYNKAISQKAVFQYGHHNNVHPSQMQQYRGAPQHQLTATLIQTGSGQISAFANEKRHKTPDKIDFYHRRNDRSTSNNNINRNISSSGRSSGLHTDQSTGARTHQLYQGMSSSNMHRGAPQLTQNSSSRKQGPKGRVTTTAFSGADDHMPKRHYQKSEPTTGRVQPRKSTLNQQQSGKQQQRGDGQMKRAGEGKYQQIEGQMMHGGQESYQNSDGTSQRHKMRYY